MSDDKSLIRRIDAARQDRNRHETWLNECLRLALPTYRRVNQTLDPEGRVQEQDDQFDNSLEITAEDFASDMISTFTPQHERWVTFEPSEDLTEGQRKEIAPQLEAFQRTINAEIDRSNYYDAAQECFAFWGVGAMVACISDMGPTNPLHFQPVEIPDALLERGPDGSVTDPAPARSIPETFRPLKQASRNMGLISRTKSTATRAGFGRRGSSFSTSFTYKSVPRASGTSAKASIAAKSGFIFD